MENSRNKKIYNVVQGNKDISAKEQEQHTYRLFNCWKRQLTNKLTEISLTNVDNLMQEDLMNLALAAVKYVNLLKRVPKDISYTYKETSFTETQNMFTFFSTVVFFISKLTPTNFVKTFPVTKFYNGEKHEVKDYNYTITKLAEFEENEPIGQDRFIDLLWDYTNIEVEIFLIEYLSTMSRLYRFTKGTDPLSEFFINLGTESDKANDCNKNHKNRKLYHRKNTSNFRVIKNGN